MKSGRIASYASALKTTPDVVGAYLLSPEAQVPIEALARCVDTSQITIVAHERTTFSESALRQGVIDAIIAQKHRSRNSKRHSHHAGAQ